MAKNNVKPRGQVDLTPYSFSYQNQIAELTARQPLHLVQVIKMAIDEAPSDDN